MSAEGKGLDLGSGSVPKLLVKLALPAMISMFFQNLYTLVDTIFVSWVGDAALAAVGLVMPIFYLALAFSKGVGVGTTALMSHALGRGDQDRAARLAASGMPLLLLGIAPLLLLIFPAINRHAIAALGAHGAILTEAQAFAPFYVLSFTPMAYATVCEAIFMSHGDTRTPMKAMILGNLINLALDPVLIFVLALGVTGAGLATLIGWTVAALYLHQALRRHGLERPRWAPKKEVRLEWRGILGLSWIVSLTMLLSPTSLMALNYLLAPYGAAAMGAWNLSSRLELMVLLPMVGLSGALIPFFGFNQGRGDRARMASGVRHGLIIGSCVAVPASLIFLLWGADIMALFKPSPEVLHLASYAIRASATAWCLTPLELVVLGLAQGSRRPQFSLLITCVRMLALRVPLAVWLGWRWQVEGIYWSHPAAMVLGGILSIVMLQILFKRVAVDMGSRPAKPEAEAMRL